MVSASASTRRRLSSRESDSAASIWAMIVGMSGALVPGVNASPSASPTLPSLSRRRFMLAPVRLTCPSCSSPRSSGSESSRARRSASVATGTPSLVRRSTSESTTRAIPSRSTSTEMSPKPTFRPGNASPSRVSTVSRSQSGAEMGRPTSISAAPAASNASSMRAASPPRRRRSPRRRLRAGGAAGSGVSWSSVVTGGRARCFALWSRRSTPKVRN